MEKFIDKKLIQIERVIKEYPPIAKQKNNLKEVTFRIRLIERPHVKVGPRLIDIREYLVDTEKAVLTTRGISFTYRQLGELINTLIKAKEEFYGADSGIGNQDTGNSQDQRQLV